VTFVLEKLFIGLAKQIAEPQREAVDEQATFRTSVFAQDCGQMHGLFHAQPGRWAPLAVMRDTRGHFFVTRLRGSDVNDVAALPGKPFG
jgi:hypothetical protein